MSTESSSSKEVLKVSGLSFSYVAAAPVAGAAEHWSIRDLSISVEAGEIVCILGASGCGKTTLLNLIAGLLQPAGGSIEVANQKTGRRRIGYIFQDDALFPWRTVEANLMLATQVAGEPSRDAARELIRQYLRSFHLDEKVLSQYPSQLSGGMRQRVSIIQSLMFDPELFLLDEPFSALDFYTKLKLEDEFWQLIKDQNKAAILVTHDIEESVAMADRVLIMNKSGLLTREFEISLADGLRLPEEARGTTQFAEYYRSIWSELKAVIVE